MQRLPIQHNYNPEKHKNHVTIEIAKMLQRNTFSLIKACRMLANTIVQYFLPFKITGKGGDKEEKMETAPIQLSPLDWHDDIIYPNR